VQVHRPGDACAGVRRGDRCAPDPGRDDRAQSLQPVEGHLVEVLVVDLADEVGHTPARVAERERRSQLRAEAVRPMEQAVPGTQLRAPLGGAVKRRGRGPGAVQLGELVEVVFEELVVHPGNGHRPGQVLDDRGGAERRGVRVRGAQQHAGQAQCVIERGAQTVDEFGGARRVGGDLPDAPFGAGQKSQAAESRVFMTHHARDVVGPDRSCQASDQGETAQHPPFGGWPPVRRTGIGGWPRPRIDRHAGALRVKGTPPPVRRIRFSVTVAALCGLALSGCEMPVVDGQNTDAPGAPGGSAEPSGSGGPGGYGTPGVDEPGAEGTGTGSPYPQGSPSKSPSHAPPEHGESPTYAPPTHDKKYSPPYESPTGAPPMHHNSPTPGY